ncbi:MAG: hypothetical protein ACK5PS_06865 [Desulfopila sp.]
MEHKEKPDPERVAVLRSLPLEIKQRITGEEAEAFMYNRQLPDSLLEKLQDFLVPEDNEATCRKAGGLTSTQSTANNSKETTVMAEETKNVCPTCQGKKIIEGVCEVSPEWRGTQNDDSLDDMQCTPDEVCPTCKGTGYEE